MRPLIIVNWKCNKTTQDSLEWLQKVGPRLESYSKVEVVLCPSFVLLPVVAQTVRSAGYPLRLGAQTVSSIEGGAYTGEVSAIMLKGMVDYVLIGHSERRDVFGETDQQVDQKAQIAAKYGLMPVVLVQGEQTPIPEGVKLVAYEPVFAIGTGKADTPDNANKVAQAVKNKRPNVIILYGGSVNPDNIKLFLDQPHISGTVVATASLVPQNFLELLDALR